MSQPILLCCLLQDLPVRFQNAESDAIVTAVLK